jgi:hypothetical protein
MLSRVYIQERTLVFNTICTQNTGVIKDIINLNILLILKRESDRGIIFFLA